MCLTRWSNPRSPLQGLKILSQAGPSTGEQLHSGSFTSLLSVMQEHLTCSMAAQKVVMNDIVVGSSYTSTSGQFGNSGSFKFSQETSKMWLNIQSAGADEDDQHGLNLDRPNSKFPPLTMAQLKVSWVYDWLCNIFCKSFLSFDLWFMISTLHKKTIKIRSGWWSIKLTHVDQAETKPINFV